MPLFEGRWLLKARDFSKLLDAAKIRPTDLVLDIGFGRGYSSAVIAHLASVVVGLEDNEAAIADATSTCADFGFDNTAFVEGPLSEGYAEQGPYDVIVIAAGVEELPEALFDQLNPAGGRLVTIEMKRGVGHAMLYTRHEDAIGDRRLFECHPAGVLSGFAREAGFVF